MKKLSFILLAICFTFASCNSDDNDPQTEESQKLEKMYREIVKASLANSKPCTNPDEWSFTAVNLSACGKDSGFIIYSKKINTEEFIKKVEKYLEAQMAFNKKWNIALTCEIRSTPSGVDCADGKPVLIYNHIIF